MVNEKIHAKQADILAIILIILLIPDIIFLFVNKNLTHSLRFIIPLILLYFVIRFGPQIKKEQDKSDRFYYGAKAESFIFFKLSQLPYEYLIFQDVKLPNKKGNIDFVVLGPTGIFTIEVKSHRGNIDFNGQKLIRKGIPLYGDFLKQALTEALSSHDYIKNKIKQDIFVQSVLVFSSQYAKLNFNPGLINNVFVLTGGDLIAHITSQPLSLNSELIVGLEGILKDLIYKH
jgi:hypothetical protein